MYKAKTYNVGHNGSGLLSSIERARLTNFIVGNKPYVYLLQEFFKGLGKVEDFLDELNLDADKDDTWKVSFRYKNDPGIPGKKNQRGRRTAPKPDALILWHEKHWTAIKSAAGWTSNSENAYCHVDEDGRQEKWDELKKDLRLAVQILCPRVNGENRPSLQDSMPLPGSVIFASYHGPKGFDRESLNLVLSYTLRLSETCKCGMIMGTDLNEDILNSGPKRIYDIIDGMRSRESTPDGTKLEVKVRTANTVCLSSSGPSR